MATDNITGNVERAIINKGNGTFPKPGFHVVKLTAAESEKNIKPSMEIAAAIAGLVSSIRSEIRRRAEQAPH